MEKHEYATMFHLENHFWWYNGLRHFVLTMLRNEQRNDRTLRLLDAGCGTGGVLEALKEAYEFEGTGFDFSEEGLSYCRQRGLKKLLRASVNEMPFDDKHFDVIISLDVLCHRSISDDVQILRDFHRLLRPGGLLLLNLPAFNWLMSSHDVAVHTVHRFTRPEIRQKLVLAGFSKIRVSYRNTILFPLLAIIRLLRKRRARNNTEEISDLEELPQIVNNFLSGILNFENYWLKQLNFPFGLSLFCLARKQ